MKDVANIVAIFDKSLTREDRMKLWTLVGTIEAECNNYKFNMK